MSYSDSKTLSLQPVTPAIQRITIYQTTARIYVIGSDFTSTFFYVLKIDRTEQNHLKIDDDKRNYTECEIKDLLIRIDGGNSCGLQKTVSSFGIVGFIRFLEGYYFILITKRRKMALIGCHVVYKIEDAFLMYIPNSSNKVNPDESHYVKTFLNVDLSSNFYFSYSYDLSNTLQSQMRRFPQTSEPSEKFIWNSYLLKDFKYLVSPKWILHIIHGFVSQNCLSIFGRSLYITLIARRSRLFAGTRYMKRGLNDVGHVANEVETEQIVYDAIITSHNSGKYTSFVQLRGSVPSFWSQDPNARVMPKPPIRHDRNDPFSVAAAQHFNYCFCRYGSPVIIVNLVKKKEKKPHESLLSKDLETSINYLNQFLPPKSRIIYIHCDMARINRSKDQNIIKVLENLSYKVLRMTRYFHSGPDLYRNQVKPHPLYKDFWNRLSITDLSFGRDQNGIIRVNCVDCLDRTNTAQFMIGKCALGYQLYSLGVVDCPTLEFDSDIIKLFEEMYEAHGDTIALQYGGSQLVHRIRTYRKISPISSHGRDIMQTITRYYNNAFTDQDKQMAINLFLGIFIPEFNILRLWDLQTDFYHHHLLASSLYCLRPPSYTKWWDKNNFPYLPNKSLQDPQLDILDGINNYELQSTDAIINNLKNDSCLHSQFQEAYNFSYSDSSISPITCSTFEEYYLLCELTSFHTLFPFMLSTQYSSFEFTPQDAIDLSPFTIRSRNLSGKISIISGNTTRKAIVGTPAPNVEDEDDEISVSSGSSGDDSDESQLAYCNSIVCIKDGNSNSGRPLSTPKQNTSTFSSKSRYGFEIEEPEEDSKALYFYSQQISIMSKKQISVLTSENALLDLKNWISIRNTIFQNDSKILFNFTKLPVVSSTDLQIYRNTIEIGNSGAKEFTTDNLLYQRYKSLFNLIETN